MDAPASRTSLSSPAAPAPRSLADLLAAEGALPVRRALRLAIDVADAVAAAHARGVVYRGLHPDEVLVLPAAGGEPERAIVVGSEVPAKGSARPAVAEAAAAAASPYTSPERAAGGPATSQADVFAVGSVALSMFVGGPPSPVRGPVGPAAEATAGAAPTAGGAEPGRIVQLLRRARAADPARRPATAAVLAAELRALDRALTEHPAPPPAPPQPTAAMSAAARTPWVPPGFVLEPAPPTLRSSLRRWRRAVGVTVATGVAGALGAAGVAWAGRAWLAREPDEPASVAAEGQLAQSTATSRSALVAGTYGSAPVSATSGSAPPVLVGPALPTGSARPGGPAVSETESERATPAPVVAPARVASTAPGPVAARRPAEGGPAPVRRATGSAAGDVVAARRVDTGASSDRPAPRPAAPVATVAQAGSLAPSAPAGTPAVSAPAPPPPPPSPAPRPAAVAITEAAAPAAEAVRVAAGVRAAVAEYASAIEARDLASLARAYPGLTDAQRRAWATFFDSVRDLRARLVVDEVAAAGATARARVSGSYEYQNRRPRRAERTPVHFTATLARDGAGWRVRTVE